MISIPIRERNFDHEFILSASRSSGPGGQNVNKVSTKIELRFNVLDSLLLSEEEKDIVSQKLSTRINNVGELIIVSQSERTQLQNKASAIEKFYSLVEKALLPVRKRKHTKPSYASTLRRLEHKKLLSKKKANRKNSGLE
jgi:ribosome-associated protein